MYLKNLSYLLKIANKLNKFNFDFNILKRSIIIYSLNHLEKEKFEIKIQIFEEPEKGKSSV